MRFFFKAVAATNVHVIFLVHCVFVGAMVKAFEQLTLADIDVDRSVFNDALLQDVSNLLSEAAASGEKVSTLDKIEKRVMRRQGGLVRASQVRHGRRLAVQPFKAWRGWRRRAISWPRHPCQRVELAQVVGFVGVPDAATSLGQ